MYKFCDYLRKTWQSERKNIELTSEYWFLNPLGGLWAVNFQGKKLDKSEVKPIENHILECSLEPLGVPLDVLLRRSWPLLRRS